MKAFIVYIKTSFHWGILWMKSLLLRLRLLRVLSEEHEEKAGDYILKRRGAFLYVLSDRGGSVVMHFTMKGWKLLLFDTATNWYGSINEWLDNSGVWYWGTPAYRKWEYMEGKVVLSKQEEKDDEVSKEDVNKNISESEGILNE